MIRVRIEALAMGNVPGASLMILRPLSAELENDRVLPICIGTVEAAAIGKALSGERSARPMTHSLLVNSIAQLDGKVTRVTIDKVRGTVFYATVYIQRNGQTIKVDARPSDAVALAIKTKAPIFVSDEVMAAASWASWVNTSEGHNEVELEEFHTFVEGVVPEDFTYEGTIDY